MSTHVHASSKASSARPALKPASSYLLQRTCACGGSSGLAGECESCSSKKRLGLQTKLKVGEPGDIYEREADRIADQVMAAPAHTAVSSGPPQIQRFSGQVNGQMNTVPASVDQALTSPGRPLEPALRHDMERRFGHDFSQVRVHSGGVAEQSARDVNAHAYTVGHKIVFGTGRFAPRTQKGRQLLAHELTHVVQQSGADAIRVGPGDDKSGLPPILSLAQLAHGVQSTGAIGGMVKSTLPGLLMREPAEKDETEQSPGKDPTSKPGGKATAAADPCTAPDPQLPVYKEAEQKQRDEILQDMLRGLTATEKKDLCKRFRRALGAFSTSQMLTMKAAGVRFWRAGEFPPPFKDEYSPSKKHFTEIARYQPSYRIIQWGPRAGVDAIRHELAHAWDHVRGGKVPRLDTYKGEQLRKAVLTPAALSSESAEKRLTVEDTVGGKKQKVGLSIKDVYDRFMKLPPPANWSFANTQTAPEHVTSNVAEFYAEGYSVFHGDTEDSQAQLLCDAPELYQLLEREANEAKLAVPNRGKLDANNKANNRKCV